MENEIVEYAIKRDEAIVESIRTDSVQPFRRFINEQSLKGILPACFMLPSDEILEISIRQMALHCTSIEPEIKGLAVDWLVKNGHDLDFTK
jgi:hypothetical protein